MSPDGIPPMEQQSVQSLQPAVSETPAENCGTDVSTDAGTVETDSQENSIFEEQKPSEVPG